MPTKRSGQPANPSSTPWKARAAALLERQGLSAGIMREKGWRQLYIRGIRSPRNCGRDGRPP
jgi:hypothetical protein